MQHVGKKIELYIRFYIETFIATCAQGTPTANAQGTLAHMRTNVLLRIFY